MMPKTNTRLYVELTYPEARLSISPSISAPSTAPSILPSPPKMMAEKATSRGPKPIVGMSRTVGPTSMPAKPASAVLRTKASAEI